MQYSLQQGLVLDDIGLIAKQRWLRNFFFLPLAWSLAFEPEEAAIDEAVSMDASDVGWGDTPAATTDDTGWATFDSFTDIRMAPSRFVLLLKEAVNC